MEGYGTWEDLKERVMDAAPKLAEESDMQAFTLVELARELNMDDTRERWQLSTAVNQLANEGRLRRYPGLSKEIAIGSG